MMYIGVQQFVVETCRESRLVTDGGEAGRKTEQRHGGLSGSAQGIFRRGKAHGAWTCHIAAHLSSGIR